MRAQQKPWQFQPGQSGNPAGRPKGSRNKLADDFLDDAYQMGNIRTESLRAFSAEEMTTIVSKMV
jgi:Family of unknown function (DUF5681)